MLCLLAQERPDLDIAIVRTAPSGLAVIRQLDPGNRRLFDAEQRLFDRMAAFDLGRDFVPAIPRLPWLEPDRRRLRGLFAGATPAIPGWARFGMTADELHAVRVGRGQAQAGDPADLLRLRQVIDPTDRDATAPGPGRTRPRT